jgi:hypothetical protein
MEQNHKITMYKLLKSRNLCVEFTKHNGDYRKMTCTLQPEVLTENLGENTASSVPFDGSQNHIAVWDIEANGWRSFIFNNVIRYEVL